MSNVAKDLPLSSTAGYLSLWSDGHGNWIGMVLRENGETKALQMAQSYFFS